MTDDTLHDHERTIQVRVRSLADLFDALDPAPLEERALNGAVGRSILASARRYRSAGRLGLRLHLPESARVHSDAVANATRQHFRREHDDGERNFRRRMRMGGVTFAVASVGLAGSFWLRSQLNTVSESTLVQGLSEGLLILGWVVMWRPIEILLWERWDNHLDHGLLDRLSRIPVECVFPAEKEPDDATGRGNDGIGCADHRR